MYVFRGFYSETYVMHTWFSKGSRSGTHIAEDFKGKYGCQALMGNPLRVVGMLANSRKRVHVTMLKLTLNPPRG